VATRIDFFVRDVVWRRRAFRGLKTSSEEIGRVVWRVRFSRPKSSNNTSGEEIGACMGPRVCITTALDNDEIVLIIAKLTLNLTLFLLSVSWRTTRIAAHGKMAGRYCFFICTRHYCTAVPIDRITGLARPSVRPSARRPFVGQLKGVGTQKIITDVGLEVPQGRSNRRASVSSKKSSERQHDALWEHRADLVWKSRFFFLNDLCWNVTFKVL